MNYDTTSHKAGRYAAKFRADAKAENKNGQNIVSHVSSLETGRTAKSVKEVADMYEGYVPCGCDDK